MMQDYLKNNGIRVKDGTDLSSIMWDMISVIMEGGFAGSLIYEEEIA